MTLPDPDSVADRLPETPPVYELVKWQRLIRIYQPRRGDWSTPRRYGPLDDMRFDHHPPPCRLHEVVSVWYSAMRLLGAVAEVYGRSRRIDREAGQRIAIATVGVPLRLLDLVGVAARQVALNQEIGAATEDQQCRAWAREFYRRYPDLHGIRWRGRQTGSICILLDDRVAMEHLSAEHWPVTHPNVWPRIARAARGCRISVV